MRPAVQNKVMGSAGAVFLGIDLLQIGIRCLDFISRGQTVLSIYPFAVKLLMNPFASLIVTVIGLWLVYKAMSPAVDDARPLLDAAGEMMVRPRSRNWAKVSGCSMGVGFILALPAWYFFVRIPIASEFRHIYEGHARELGEPVGRPEDSRKTYFGSFERATVIYLESLNTIYALPLDLGKPQEAGGSPEGRGRYYCEEWIKHKLALNCDPPISGLASLWSGDPAHWSWIGCRNWHRFSQDTQFGAQFPGKTFRPVIFQRFEQGYLIGRLSHLRPADTRESKSQIIGIIPGVKWFNEITSDPPASSVDATRTTQLCDPHDRLW